MRKLQCPIDHIKVNENKVRAIALVVFVLGLVYLSTGYWPIIAYLFYDFLVRVVNRPNLSLASQLADVSIKIFRIPTKPTDRGPKRFAAGMGLAFNFVILLFALFGMQIVASWLAVALCAFAFLESFGGFCVGCYVYSGLQKLSLIP